MPPPGRGAGDAGERASRRRTIFLSAGESSGDQHAARVASEIRARVPEVRLVGLGGSRMREAGVELLADLDTLAVMGFAEVVTRLPRLLAVRWRVWRLLSREPVDLVLPVDYPGFNLGLACRARKEGIPVLYYIAPQVWAWRESRARRLARCADRVCTVLPFEADLLEGYGADVRFVGHPLLDEEGEDPVPPAGDAPVLGLFPGSRTQEVERMLPPFLEAAQRLRRRRPGLEVWVARAPDLPRELVDGADRRVAPPETVVARATAALTKSGTITLQLALGGVPMVVAYRMNPLTHWLARRLVSVEHIALVNLVAECRLVPELIQDEATPERLAELVRPLLEAGSRERRRMRTGLEAVRDRLGTPGCAARVARDALALMA